MIFLTTFAADCWFRSSAADCWFRSSVGLEQRPSKAWVLGSNPNGITERTP